MKPLRPIALLFALPLCALATELPASPCPPGLPHRAGMARPPSREQVAMRMMVRHILLNRYDADANLELDGEERHRLMADAHAARKQQALAFIRRFDADGDGALSSEERTAMDQAMAERRRPRTSSSTDGAEPQEGMQPPPPLPPRHHRKHPGTRERHHRQPHPHMNKAGQTVAFLVQKLTMDAYDADKNGILDTTESSRLKEDGEKLYSARESELLARYDTDKDGQLSEEELQAAMGELAPRPPRPRRAFPEEPGELPPPPHVQRRGPINRLLDSHFDIDILLNLAHPQAGECSTPPCSPSSPSAS